MKCVFVCNFYMHTVLSLMSTNEYLMSTPSLKVTKFSNYS